jgi:cell division control protein 6
MKNIVLKSPIMVKMDKLDKIFDSFATSTLFKDKSVLQSNYSPETILHRAEQVESIASILGPVLKGERASNLFLYGKTGTGKTLSACYVGEKIEAKAKQSGTNLQFLYVNCKSKKVSDTEYRIIAELIKLLGGNVPATGLPTDAVYSKFIELIDDKKQIVVLVLDEIDQAVKKISDNFIYTLTRMNSELKNAQVSLIGISNSLTFMDNLDPRVRSSLGEEEIIFPPYNALQLRDILTERSKLAFGPGVLGEGVIAKCGAYAAREHGDARRALDLLRVAGEIAVRNGSEKVLLKHIDEANAKIEKDKMLDIIENEPAQFQLVLHAIMLLDKRREERRKRKNEMVDDRIFTGDVFNVYQEVCEKTKNEILTQRRISDILAEFDMLGIINARVISKGRQGRTREIKLMLAPNVKEKAERILQKALGLG